MNRILSYAWAFADETARNLLVNGVAAWSIWPRPVRWLLLRWFGMTGLAPCSIAPECFFGSRDITFGERVRISRGAFFDGAAPITLGDDAGIAMGTMILTGNHEIGSSYRRAGTYSPAPVVIGRGAWIGARVVILPGVTIADGCVIAAGAVVTKSTEPDGLYVGFPAKRIKDLPREIEEHVESPTVVNMTPPVAIQRLAGTRAG